MSKTQDTKLSLAKEPSLRKQKTKLKTKFCYWQVTCKEDFNKKGEQISFSCSAHAIEERVFACPYESLEHAKNQRFPCEDAKAEVGV